MRYLKDYKLFENRISKERLEDMLDTLDEMFLDSKDEGFKLDYGGSLLNIRITKPVSSGFNMYSNRLFKITEISDTLHMIMSYLDTFTDIIEMESIEISGRGNLVNPKGGYRPGGMRFTENIKRDQIDSIDRELSEIHIIYKELGI